MRTGMAAQVLQGVALMLMVGLLAAGCGRKEPPKLAAEGAPPQLLDLKYQVNGLSLKLEFRLAGSPEGVGYQIDRAEMDPYCGCPSFFRRYFEQPPMRSQVGKKLTKILPLRPDEELVFRIRAVDAEGNLGQWSEYIHARGADLMQ